MRAIPTPWPWRPFAREFATPQHDGMAPCLPAAIGWTWPLDGNSPYYLPIMAKRAWKGVSIAAETQMGFDITGVLMVGLIHVHPRPSVSATARRMREGLVGTV